MPRRHRRSGSGSPSTAFQLEALRRPRRRPLGARVGPDRLGQDRRGRLRRGPGPGRGPPGLLHHAAQGAVEPEVRASWPTVYGPRAGGPADRRRLASGRRAGGRDDHRGPAQHALRPLAGAGRPRPASCSTRCTTSRTRYRGSVWEEVIILTPPDVVFVCLSATVSNAAEFGAWLAEVRGPTEVVVETHRPVELRHHVAVAETGEPPGRAGPVAAQAAGCTREARRPRPAHRRAWPGVRAASATARTRHPPAQRARRGARRSGACCPPSCSSSRRAACDDAVASAWTTGCASPRPNSGPRSAVCARSTPRASPTTNCGSSATAPGRPASRQAWRRTTPG